MRSKKHLESILTVCLSLICLLMIMAPRFLKASSNASPPSSIASDLRGPPSLTAQQIDAILAHYNSPATGTGPIWFTMGQKYGIDPVWGLAFFNKENSLAIKGGHCTTTYNVGNIACAGYANCHGRWRAYSSWEEGIEDWFRLIRTTYIDQWGLTTVEQIVPIYAPAFENNTTHYIAHVQGVAQLFRSQSLIQEHERCFAETEYCIFGVLLDYWKRNGELFAFGYPITEQRTEQVNGQELQVQWFERAKLVIQMDGQVTSDHLGAQLLSAQGRPWYTLPQQPNAPPGCAFFAETGHTLCEPFLSYWQYNGDLEHFGYPLTEQMMETIGAWTGTVQYFERRRMEHHPELPGAPVLLGLLGTELLTMRSPGQWTSSMIVDKPH